MCVAVMCIISPLVNGVDVTSGLAAMGSNDATDAEAITKSLRDQINALKRKNRQLEKKIHSNKDMRFKGDEEVRKECLNVILGNENALFYRLHLSVQQFVFYCPIVSTL